MTENPQGEFHFEMGRGLALRLGYPPTVLNVIPKAAIDSFAGVGYFFDLARLKKGESVLDLGSGSGSAQRATQKYGVKSISLCATKGA